MVEIVLVHHGIKGQKWGRRRYQNPDGTLTTEGKLRYGASAGLRQINKATITKDKNGNRNYAGQKYGQQAADIAAKTISAVSEYDAPEKKSSYEKTVEVLEIVGGIAATAATLAPYVVMGVKFAKSANAAKAQAKASRAYANSSKVRMMPESSGVRSTASYNVYNMPQYANIRRQTKINNRINSSPYVRHF